MLKNIGLVGGTPTKEQVTFLYREVTFLYRAVAFFYCDLVFLYSEVAFLYREVAFLCRAVTFLYFDGLRFYFFFKDWHEGADNGGD